MTVSKTNKQHKTVIHFLITVGGAMPGVELCVFAKLASLRSAELKDLFDDLRGKGTLPNECC